MGWVQGLGRGAAILGIAGVMGCGAAVQQARPGSGEDSVSVGFSKLRRADVASNIATVTSADAQQSRLTTVADMLRRVPGLQVFQRTNGRLTVYLSGMRGAPLFVMNGSPLPAELGVDALTGLQPADIVRIDVLRDADAAIYGMQGGNGVIVIETRHSRS